MKRSIAISINGIDVGMSIKEDLHIDDDRSMMHNGEEFHHNAKN